MQKSFLLMLLLNQLFIYRSMKECLRRSTIDWGPIDFGLIKSVLQHAYDAKSTEENTVIADRITGIVERFIEKDLVHQYYSMGDSITEENAVFHYHKGMTDAEKGEEEYERNNRRSISFLASRK